MSQGSVEIETERLRLRRWRQDDLEPFAEMNADPEVMEFFPSPLSKQESDLLAERIQRHFDEHKFGLGVAEIPGVTGFAGFVGLMVQDFEADFTPCVEIGWRLAREHWGHGYATEAARAVLKYGFATLGLSEVVSMTAVVNKRSERVMQQIGMTRNPAEDFDHPRVADGEYLKRQHTLVDKGSTNDAARHDPLEGRNLCGNH